MQSKSTYKQSNSNI